jgi:hypothetical protein
MPPIGNTPPPLLPPLWDADSVTDMIDAINKGASDVNVYDDMRGGGHFN